MIVRIVFNVAKRTVEFPNVFKVDMLKLPSGRGSVFVHNVRIDEKGLYHSEMHEFKTREVMTLDCQDES